MTILIREDEGGIATLTLNMPGKLNALSDEMIAQLHSTLDQIADEPATKVVIIKGAGKALCAGHDLSEMQTKDAAGLKDLFDCCAAMMLRIQSLPQPVIAQAHGIATAAGCQLVATCDLAIASDDCRFGVNGINIGLFCSTPMVALTRNIGRKAAFEMLTTGRFATAQEAEMMGLINRMVPAVDLDAETQALAQSIASKRTSTIRIGKGAFYTQSEMTTQDAYAFTGDVMVQNMAHPETTEGIAAFLEKRPPNWDH